MPGIDTVAVMTELAERVATITDVRVHAYPPDSVAPPAVIIDYPSTVEYDYTMGRGSDRAFFPVHVVVGRVSDRASAPALSAYLSGTGGRSIKTAIEGDATLDGETSTIRVTEATVQVMTISGVEYIGATFTVETIS